MKSCQFPAIISLRPRAALALGVLFALAHFAVAVEPGDRTPDATMDRAGNEWSNTGQSLFEWQIAFECMQADDAGGDSGTQVVATTSPHPLPLDDAVRTSLRGFGVVFRPFWEFNEEFACVLGTTGRTTMPNIWVKQLNKGSSAGRDVRSADQGASPESVMSIWLTRILVLISVIAAIWLALLHWHCRPTWIVTMD